MASLIRYGLYFTPAAVVKLNQAAHRVLAHYPRIETNHSDVFFEATKDRANETLSGDARHYGPKVLVDLVHLTVARWCPVNS
jgi:hypothetical protein